MSELLKELNKKQNELEEKLVSVRKEIHEEKLRISENRFGVRVGSIVSNNKGVEFLVTQVDTRWSGKPWLKGNQKKKDGTFGTASRNIYSDWTLLEAQQ
jgi:hypothetical protein